jgi:vancomycin resistance protein YoaR
MGIDVSLSEKAKLDELYSKYFKLPEEVTIEIGDIQHTLELAEIDAAYLPTSQEIIDSGRYKLEEVVESIDLLYKKKEFNPVVKYNEAKLDNWLDQNFKDLQLDSFRLPILKKNINGEITQCDEGNLGRRLPYDMIKYKLSNIQSTLITVEPDIVEFNSAEQLASDICNQINKFSENIALAGDHRIFEYWEIHDYFVFTENSGRLKIEISDEKKMKSKLEEVAMNLDQAEVLPEFKIYNNFVYFLGEYKPFRKLDIETSITNLKSQLLIDPSISKFKFEFIQSTVPKMFQGMPVKNYSKFVSSGYGKFKYEKSRDVNVANIQKGLAVLDGKVIPAGYDYSMIKDGLEARMSLITENGKKTTIGNYSYNIGICAVATAMYRAALEAGLPIIERHPHQQALVAYTYPYGGLVDAALYFNSGNKQDLKFTNDYTYDMLVVTESRMDNLEFNYNVRLYAPAGSGVKRVVLTDFQRDKKGRNIAFTEQFTRKVNGTSEIIKTKYYSSNF